MVGFIMAEISSTNVQALRWLWKNSTKELNLLCSSFSNLILNFSLSMVFLCFSESLCFKVLRIKRFMMKFKFQFRGEWFQLYTISLVPKYLFFIWFYPRIRIQKKLLALFTIISNLGWKMLWKCTKKYLINSTCKNWTKMLRKTSVDKSNFKTKKALVITNDSPSPPPSPPPPPPKKGWCQAGSFLTSTKWHGPEWGEGRGHWSTKSTG